MKHAVCNIFCTQRWSKIYTQVIFFGFQDWLLVFYVNTKVLFFLITNQNYLNWIYIYQNKMYSKFFSTHTLENMNSWYKQTVDTFDVIKKYY